MAALLSLNTSLTGIVPRLDQDIQTAAAMLILALARATGPMGQFALRAGVHSRDQDTVALSGTHLRTHAMAVVHSEMMLLAPREQVEG